MVAVYRKFVGGKLTGQVRTHEGGVTFAVDKWTRLARFLTLGSDGGTFYVGERDLTVDNARVVADCLDEDAARTVAQIVAVSEAGARHEWDKCLPHARVQGPRKLPASGRFLSRLLSMPPEEAVSEISSKACTKCGVVKPIESFSVDRHHRTGRQAHCRACRQAAREANKEAVNAGNRDYYRRNREKCLAYGREYRRTHREKRRAIGFAYYRSNKERIDERVRRWQAANRDRVVASRGRSYQRNRDVLRARSRAYYESRREDQCAKARARNRRNGYRCDPELRREASARRRARIRGNQTERIDRRFVYERDQGKCHLCGGAVDPDCWQLEYIIPIVALRSR